MTDVKPGDRMMVPVIVEADFGDGWVRVAYNDERKQTVPNHVLRPAPPSDESLVRAMYDVFGVGPGDARENLDALFDIAREYDAEDPVEQP